MHRYVSEARLGKSGGCHLFRHTMATLMLENGADVRFIQALLGHGQLNTTALCTHVSIPMLQAVHRRTHLGAREADSIPHGSTCNTTCDGCAVSRYTRCTVFWKSAAEAW